MNLTQANEVLRYWLAALQLEESLQARPQARPPARGLAAPRLEQPTTGQDYFKLPLDAPLEGLLTKHAQLTRAFDAELSAFFESWLYGQYRRGADDGDDAAHLLCFPVLRLPQGELAGVVRCPVQLRFGSAGSAPFRAPTRAERQRGAYPAPPEEARLTRAPPASGGWPFFVDTRALRHPLGVPTESLDAFYEALRRLPSVSERQMLGLLTAMLEDVASRRRSEPESTSDYATRLLASVKDDQSELQAWLERLTAALRRLLEPTQSRARVYSVGIVIDATRAKTTWHLQRELEALLDGGRTAIQLATPLGAYLTGQPLPAGAAPQRALFPGPPLSVSQRAAAEAFWGSPLSAVQGPPGTGKTRLILHLCAEHLVRQVEALLSGGAQRAELFLVTSSNNRAVDNVLEPLDTPRGLPLALRVGSRQVCEHHLAAQLRRALGWLQSAQSASQAEREARLGRAKARFNAARDALDGLLAPRRSALERAAKRARIEQELAECAPHADEPLAPLSKPHATAILLGLEGLEKRLRLLSELCEAPPSAAAVRAVEQHYKRTTKRHLPAAKEALARAKLTLELALPPNVKASAPVEQQLEEWEEASERGLAHVAELRGVVTRAAAAAGNEARARLLRAQLAALPVEPPPPPPIALEALEPAASELFAAAAVAREAWAAERAGELSPALALALRTVEQERSLRSLFRSEAQAARLLCRLFPIWGSTLLSLGNCLPSDAGSIARLVIDEAGQCHPAHAVSGLMRAESALVIGDVHQLSPVIELGIDDEARLLRACRLTTPVERLLPYRVHSDAASSTQALADRAVVARGKLTDHFRCQPEIIRLSDALCGYGLTIHTPRADRSSRAPYLQRPLALVDLRGEQARWGGSFCNELESQETLRLVESLLGAGIRLEEIAIITPYRGQLEHLRRGLSERRIRWEASAELAESGGGGAQQSGIALGTVHRFQGGERSIVLFSSVVSHPRSLPFLNARPNLLNVAISRAQHHFICLGHAPVLAEGALSRVLVAGVERLAPSAYAPSARSDLDLFGGLGVL